MTAKNTKILCSPDEVTTGDEHKHHCFDCNITWKHSKSVIETLTKAEHIEAHQCPNCQAKCGYKFEGDEPLIDPVELLTTGLDALTELPSFVFGIVDIAYREGFEKKHKRGVIVTTKDVVDDEKAMRAELDKTFEELEINVDDVIDVTLEGTVVAPPVELQEKFLARKGLVATNA